MRFEERRRECWVASQMGGYLMLRKGDGKRFGAMARRPIVDLELHFYNGHYKWKICN